MPDFSLILAQRSFAEQSSSQLSGASDGNFVFSQELTLPLG